eukprot:Opistho-2@12027
MGLSISRRVQWTARYGGPPTDSTGGRSGDKVDMTTRNETFLYELLKAVEVLVQNNPREAAVEFARPLQWQTVLRAGDFAQSRHASEYDIHDNDSDKSGVSSKEKRIDGKPLLHLEQMGDNLYVVKVSSFEFLSRVLTYAGTRRIKELQACIEANNDPLGSVSGVTADSTASALIASYERVQKLQAGETAEAEGVSAMFRLLLQLNLLDQRLLAAATQELSKEVHLGMDSVQAELELLQSFCGNDATNCLRNIDWESDYIFANGCRAPPWRQIYGELCYLDARPMEGDRVIITASAGGFFVNGGYTVDADGQEHMSYDRVGDLYPSLVALFRARSKHFAKTIDRQEMSYQPSRKQREVAEALTLPRSPLHQGENILDEDAEDADAAGERAGSRARADRAQKQALARAAKKKGAAAVSNSTHAPQRTVDPSPKWRNLGLGKPIDGTVGPADASSVPARTAPGSPPTRGGKKSPHGRHEGKSPNATRTPGVYGDGKDAYYSESDSDESEEEDTQDKKRQEANAELPPEYWQIQKLVKYLKGGNQTATIIALCSLRDFDLGNETNQLAIRDVGGLDVLINLLDTEDVKCKVGALQILKEISKNYQIKKAIAELDGIQPLVELLKDPNEELKCLAAETIAHCAKYARNRCAIRHYGGIRKLVRMLKGDKSGAPRNDSVARSGALALWSCSKSRKNKEAIRNAGAVPLLAKLLESQNEALLIPVVGIMQECSSDGQYRIMIRTSGMIRHLVANLNSTNAELQTHCASAIFKCAEDPETRDLVRKFGGLDPLVRLLHVTDNKELLAAATGAVWKCAANAENVGRFQELRAIDRLVSLLRGQPEDVLINVVGALGECAQTSENRKAIRSAGGIQHLVNLLTGTNRALLVNVTKAVGACALESENMVIIDKLDGVRLLWSLLKSPNPDVQASAAWAICPCIENAKDAGEMVRSFVGGLELIVSLLKSEDSEVLASVCAAIANIAKDEENLAVITDHGVVPMLAKLAQTLDDRLRRHLAEAIARCCHWGNNRVTFGSAGAVAPLVKYLRSPDEQVHRATARALYQLSLDPDNCITMHESGVVPLLLGMVGSSDEGLQEAAAGCIANIRRLALASEKAAQA